MTKYIVVETIDNRPPGTDVTNVYGADVMARLIEEGYVAEDKPKAKRKKQAAPDEPADDQPADEDGD